MPEPMRLRSHWRQTFPAYDLRWYDLLHVLWFLRENNCQSCLSLLCDSLKCTCNYCVDGLIWHFKFPKLVLARISGEVGTLCTVLLSVYFGTCLPIFIEIGSYLTDLEKKLSWHGFFLRRGIIWNLYRLLYSSRNVLILCRILRTDCLTVFPVNCRLYTHLYCQIHQIWCIWRMKICAFSSLPVLKICIVCIYILL